MNGVNFDSEAKVWSGQKHDPIYNTNASLGYLILNVLRNTPDRITQVSDDTNVEITCNEMRMRSIKIANHLMITGLKQGDIVGVMATNSENLAPVVFACLTLGLPLNFLAPVMIESDVTYMFTKTEPKIIFCDANVVKVVQNSVALMTTKAKIYTLMEKVQGCQFVDEILSTAVDDFEFV